MSEIIFGFKLCLWWLSDAELENSSRPLVFHGLVVKFQVDDADMLFLRFPTCHCFRKLWNFFFVLIKEIWGSLCPRIRNFFVFTVAAWSFFPLFWGLERIAFRSVNVSSSFPNVVYNWFSLIVASIWWYFTNRITNREGAIQKIFTSDLRLVRLFI